MNKFTDNYGKLVALPPDSKAYRQINYKLSLYLGLPSAEILLSSISSIPPNYNEDKIGENENFLEAWVNKDKLQDDQSLENTFNINSDRPMKFTVGSLFDNDDIPENTEFTFFI